MNNKKSVAVRLPVKGGATRARGAAGDGLLELRDLARERLDELPQLEALLRLAESGASLVAAPREHRGRCTCLLRDAAEAPHAKRRAWPRSIDPSDLRRIRRFRPKGFRKGREGAAYERP